MRLMTGTSSAGSVSPSSVARVVVTGSPEAQDLYCEWQRSREIEEAGAVLVRPDGVVAWRDKYKVHPYADHYPMMEGEQFADLVRDITEKGLKTPITVDKDCILLDGRNRLEALERAGIELRSWQIQIYRGDDRVGFIKSANAHRRPLALTFAPCHQVPTKPAHLL